MKEQNLVSRMFCIDKDVHELQKAKLNHKIKKGIPVLIFLVSFQNGTV